MTPKVINYVMGDIFWKQLRRPKQFKSLLHWKEKLGTKSALKFRLKRSEQKINTVVEGGN